MTFIRITEIPPGEAPESVRAAWIGVVIPLAEIDYPQPNWWATSSVLPKPAGVLQKIKRLFFKELDDQPWHGYVVKVVPAIAALYVANPTAANWWQVNTPHLLTEDATFIFPSSCCIETSGETV